MSHPMTSRNVAHVIANTSVTLWRRTSPQLCSALTVSGNLLLLNLRHLTTYYHRNRVQERTSAEPTPAPFHGAFPEANAKRAPGTLNHRRPKRLSTCPTQTWTPTLIHYGWSNKTA